MTGRIEFKNVWFRYPSRKNDWILKGLNLTINPNETIALVGESGCGKSTLVSLLLRFYDPDFGQITLDGVELSKYNLQSLREVMGLVMQEPTLFNYNITENILYGKLKAHNSEIKEAATIANAIEFIESQNVSSSKYEDNAEILLKELDMKAKQVVQDTSANEYREKRKALAEIIKKERKKGHFVAVEGDIDTRNPELKDEALHPGFKIECGLKGSKLSGGQK